MERTRNFLTRMAEKLRKRESGLMRFEELIAKHSTGKIVCTAGMELTVIQPVLSSSDAEMFENLFHNPQALSVGYTDNKPFPQRVTRPIVCLNRPLMLYCMPWGRKDKAIRTLLASQERPTNEFPALFLKTSQTTFLPTFLKPENRYDRIYFLE